MRGNGRKKKLDRYDGPAGGWGSLKSLAGTLAREQTVFKGPPALLHQNKHGGFACVSCAWAKPEHPRVFEFCENGAKATAAEITAKRATPAFFAEHTLTELENWSDHDLEAVGRLTHPLKWDRRTDRYLPIAWETAFQEIGDRLKTLAPREVVFYASGRASLEATYMYQLFARLYGSNNLPDSSNMCHESTSVALPLSIGVPVGTVTLDDFTKTDFIFFFGQNVGSNSPRMLHSLQEASCRGAEIVTFNPFRERGLERFTNPQAPAEMLMLKSTRISSHYYQVKAGGDLAAIAGICKALLDLARDDQRDSQNQILDLEFIRDHTHGFDEFRPWLADLSWTVIEQKSGLSRDILERVARLYGKSSRAMAVYGMGITQHRSGVENVEMLVNLLLLKGNIGKPGAGICPVRGHSNVQGQRTVGMTEKPELAPLDRLAAQYSFEPPRWTGLATVDACKGMLDGKVRGFMALGGNFVRAVPEQQKMEQSWRHLELSVHIATKLNRSHVIHGENAYLLPCLGRLESDLQQGIAKTVSVEDSTGFFHPSHGRVSPASDTLLSEPAIVAGMAQATVGNKGNVPWAAWLTDYAVIRDAIAETYPDVFKDFNKRLARPGGFQKPIPARERIWKTKSGKANFLLPESLEENEDVVPSGGDILQLITIRSNGQFNTTIYNYSDRLRGIEGRRDVLLMSPYEIERRNLSEGDLVIVNTVADDGVPRQVTNLRLVCYDLPAGCCASYYPECNVLVPLWHHAKKSKVPASKSIPVRVERMEDLAASTPQNRIAERAL